MITVIAIGIERLAFDAGEGEKRHINENDDGLAIDGRLDHLLCRGRDRLQALVQGKNRGRARAGARPGAARLFSAMMTAPSTISPKSSAPRLIRFALSFALQHSRRGDQHGDRNDQCRDQRGAEVPKQQEQHENDQQGAFREVRRHGVDRGIDELGAIEHRLRADARRERPIDLLDLGVRRRRHGSAVAADQHQRSAENDLASVHACAAGSELASERNLGNVLDAYRHRLRAWQRRCPRYPRGSRRGRWRARRSLRRCARYSWRRG